MISSVPPAGIGATLPQSHSASRANDAPPAANDRRPDTPASTVALVEGWRGQREALRVGLSSLDSSAAAARVVAGALEAFAGGAADLRATASTLNTAIEAAVGQGGALVTGASLRLDLGDGGEGFDVAGVDLRFTPPPESALADATVAGMVRERAADAAQAARGAAANWDGVAQRLHGHDRVLATASARAALPALDQQGALLAALQVKQALVDSGGAIANADPKAILALFRV